MRTTADGVARTARARRPTKRQAALPVDVEVTVESEEDILDPAAGEDESETWVDGRVVVSRERVASNLPAVPGKEPSALRIVHIVFDDSSELFKCMDCDYSHAKRGPVQRHRVNGHKAVSATVPKKSATAERSLHPEIAAMSVTELLSLATGALTIDDTLSTQDEALEEWRDRALDAERKLAKVQDQDPEELEQWRQRAENAERKLAKFRGMFAGLFDDD